MNATSEGPGSKQRQNGAWSATHGNPMAVAPPGPAVEMRQVCKRFGGVHALRDFSLHVDYGEIVAIVGNNGAGKSTLMSIIAGSFPPDSGTLIVGGEAQAFRNPWQARDCGIEHVPQDLALAEQLSVDANMFLGREITKRIAGVRILDKRQMRERARQIIEDFDIHLPTYRSRVFDLSGGQKQGVAIGRAVTWAKRLVLLDEPTAALGQQETLRVEETIRELKAANIGILLISHNLDQVFRVADRAYVIRRGEQVGERQISETDPTELVSLITGASPGGPQIVS